MGNRTSRRLDDMRTDIATLREDMATLREDITGNRTSRRLDDMRTDIARLTAVVTNGFNNLQTSVERLETSVERLEASVERLEYGTSVANGEAVAKAITVAIKESVSSDTSGHGTVFEFRGKIYLLSAAHVLAFFPPKKQPIVVTWTDGSDGSLTNISVKVVRMFFRPDYFLDGSRDVGLVEVSMEPQDRHRLNTIQVEFLEGATVGTTLVGSGSVFLFGKCVSSQESGRTLIHALSVPGCSGCPLLNNFKQVAGIVHGSSKHRHSSGNNGTSNMVYVDVPQLQGLAFNEVDTTETSINLIQAAEFLSPEEAEHDDTFYDYGSIECPVVITMLVERLDLDENQRYSVKSLMAIVAKRVVTATTMTLTKDLECLSPKNGE